MMRSIRNIPFAAAILTAGLALVMHGATGCVSTDECPTNRAPTVGAACVGQEVCKYAADVSCNGGGEFQCISGVWAQTAASDALCGGGGDGRCPSGQPAQGSACASVAATCNYVHPDGCRQTLVCDNGAWHDQGGQVCSEHSTTSSGGKTTTGAGTGSTAGSGGAAGTGDSAATGETAGAGGSPATGPATTAASTAAVTSTATATSSSSTSASGGAGGASPAGSGGAGGAGGATSTGSGK